GAPLALGSCNVVTSCLLLACLFHLRRKRTHHQRDSQTDNHAFGQKECIVPPAEDHEANRHADHVNLAEHSLQPAGLCAGWWYAGNQRGNDARHALAVVEVRLAETRGQERLFDEDEPDLKEPDGDDRKERTVRAHQQRKREGVEEGPEVEWVAAMAERTIGQHGVAMHVLRLDDTCADVSRSPGTQECAEAGESDGKHQQRDGRRREAEQASAFKLRRKDEPGGLVCVGDPVKSEATEVQQAVDGKTKTVVERSGFHQNAGTWVVGGGGVDACSLSVAEG